MRNRFRVVLTAGVTAVVVSALWLLMTPVVGQQRAARFPVYRPTRMADGHPDLNGIWQALLGSPGTGAPTDNSKDNSKK